VPVVTSPLLIFVSRASVEVVRPKTSFSAVRVFLSSLFPVVRVCSNLSLLSPVNLFRVVVSSCLVWVPLRSCSRVWVYEPSRLATWVPLLVSFVSSPAFV